MLRVYNKGKTENKRLQNCIANQANIDELNERIKRLIREKQQINEELVGVNEREKQYLNMKNEFREEKDVLEKELNEIKISHSGLEGKYLEVLHNYKEKCLQWDEESDAFDKLEKEKADVIEDREKILTKAIALEKELKERNEKIITQREAIWKIKDRLICIENDYDSLNSKQNTAREILQTENYELKHQITVLKEKVHVFKSSRHHWLKNIDTEVQENNKARVEISDLKTQISDLQREKQDIIMHKNNIDKEKYKLIARLEEKEKEYAAVFAEKENLDLCLQSKNEMYDQLELRTKQYIARIVGEHKSLK